MVPAPVGRADLIEMAMQDTPDNNDRPRIGWWLTFTIGLVLAYPLSFGPLAWLVLNGFMKGGRPILSIYALPLQWMVNHSNLFLDLYMSYLSLWGYPGP